MFEGIFIGLALGLGGLFVIGVFAYLIVLAEGFKH